MTTVFITGGHSGIGLECSRQLAAKGVNIILAGRSPGKMQSVADELRAVGEITVTTVELDTSSLVLGAQRRSHVRRDGRTRRDRTVARGAQQCGRTLRRGGQI